MRPGITRAEQRFWVTIPTRWADMDAMNHVNNAVYFTYLETARIDLFRALGLRDAMHDEKHGIGLVAVNCNYRRQLHYPEVIEVGSRVTRIGARSFELAHTLFLEGTETVVADGGSVLVWVDYGEGKSVPLPAFLREGLEAQLGNPEAS